MNLIMSIVAYVKTHVISSIIVSVVLVSGVIATPIIINNINSNEEIIDKEINKQEENIEKENKYITIKFEISGEDKCLTRETLHTKDYQNCDIKITNATIENDKNDLFKDIVMVDKSFVPVFDEIFNLSLQNDLIALFDYRYLTSTEYKNIREIIIKPEQEIIQYNGKFNLNDNIVVYASINEYYETTSTFANTLLSKFSDGINYGNPDATFPYFSLSQMFVKKVNVDTINKISELPGHNLIEYTTENINNGDENINYDLVIMEKLSPFGPWFQKDIKSNPVGYDTSGVYAINFKSYVEEFNHYQYQRDILQEYNIIANWYSKYDNKYGKNYYILNEEICEKYNLNCDRW